MDQESMEQTALFQLGSLGKDFAKKEDRKVKKSETSIQKLATQTLSLFRVQDVKIALISIYVSLCQCKCSITDRQI